MIDAGETDWKVLAIDVNDPKASSVNTAEDAKREFPEAVEAVFEFLVRVGVLLVNKKYSQIVARKITKPQPRISSHSVGLFWTRARRYPLLSTPTPSGKPSFPHNQRMAKPTRYPFTPTSHIVSFDMQT